jgi:hypothetical protein
MATVVPSVTPAPGTNAVTVAPAVPVQAAPPNINGGYIVNPLSAGDQGLATAETLYVDPVSPAPGLEANGTTVALLPGQSFDLIPGTTLPTTVVTPSGGHMFTVVIY